MTHSANDTTEVHYLEEVIAIAVEAGKEAMKHRRHPHTREKGDHADDTSPVTDADLASNRYITKHLKLLNPQIPIVSEEIQAADYETRKDWQRFWVVDPLDGTKEFIKGSDEFTVNIALVDGLESVIGVIYVPAKELLYYAEKDRGSWKQEQGKAPVQIFSSIPDLRKGLIVAESASHPSEELENYLKDLPVRERISAGSSLKFCLVAQGSADIYPRLNPTMEWDVAAGDCIFRNSGREGPRKTSFKYNKPNLKNDSFVIGFM